MTVQFLQTLPQVVVERMLNGALEGIVLAGLAWILLRAVGRRSSSTRFAVWFVVLLAVVMLPWAESLRVGPSAISTGSSRSAVLIPGSWALGMFYVWAAIALASLSRVALGLWQIRRLRQNCSLLDPFRLDPTLRRTLSDSCTRPISLYVSPAIRVPMATGFFRPMIVVPEWTLRELSTDELRVVLLHEAAHLRRWDDWTNLAQKIVRAVFFFHPVIWWLEGKLALEREMACDDLVVATTSSPRAYAECLVALAEKSLGRRNFALAQAAVNRMRHTSLRIRQILDGRSGPTRVWKPAVGYAVAAAMACVLYANETPKLIGFSSPTVEGKGTIPVTAQVPRRADASNSLIKSTAFSITPARRKVLKRVVSAPGMQVAANKDAANTSENAKVFPVRIAEPVQIPGAAAHTIATYQSVTFAASETVFVVMQDEQFTASGDKVVRFNVYRLTVFYPEFYPSNPQKILSKSI